MSITPIKAESCILTGITSVGTSRILLLFIANYLDAVTFLLMLYYLGPWFEANEIVKQVLYDVGIFGLLGMRFLAVTVASVCTIPYRKLNLFVTAIVLYAAWTNVNTLRLNLF